MKKTTSLFALLILFGAFSTMAQENKEEVKNTPEKKWDASQNPTVQAITSQFQLKEMPKPLTDEKIFPALGEYQSNHPEAGNVKIVMDPQVKGIVWVEGLPQGRIKAYLRKSPATYKIPAQQNEEGKEVAEGTLVYNQDTKELHVCIGKKYNAEDPESAFIVEDEPMDESMAKNEKTKSKTQKKEEPKPWILMANKVEKTETDVTTTPTAMN